MQRNVCVLTKALSVAWGAIVLDVGRPIASTCTWMCRGLYSEIKHTVVKLWQATDSYHAKCHRSQISSILGCRDVHVFDLV